MAKFYASINQVGCQKTNKMLYRNPFLRKERVPIFKITQYALRNTQSNLPVFTKTKIILPLSIILAAIFAFFEAGNYLASWLSAALIFFLGLAIM